MDTITVCGIYYRASEGFVSNRDYVTITHRALRPIRSLLPPHFPLTRDLTRVFLTR